MKTNTTKFIFTTLFAHVMCLTVVLSHLHATDAVSALSGSSMKVSLGSDLAAKTLGDLHHHIDKAALKHITGDASQIAAARTRQLQPEPADLDDSLPTRLHDFTLRFRVVTTLLFQQTLA
ncbi:MAG TPA: hypothetical protein VF597_03420 [Candidatus Saccharimonadales bacterium]|jgi:hypothetical protein